MVSTIRMIKIINIFHLAIIKNYLKNLKNVSFYIGNCLLMMIFAIMSILLLIYDSISAIKFTS